MTEKELIYITTIAEEGSIAKAVKKLNMNQSSLSRCIQKIESELSITLFKRTQQGLVPTPEGTSYIQTAYQILKIYNDLKQDFDDSGQLLYGKLTIGCESYHSHLLFPFIISKFQSLYPNVTIHLLEATQQELQKLLLLNRLDLAVLYLPSIHEELSYKVVVEDRFVLAAPYNHAIKDKSYKRKNNKYRFIHLTSLYDETFILPYPTQSIRESCNQVLKNAALTPNKIHLIESIDTLKRLVALEMGLALLPESYIEEHNNTGLIDYYYLEEILSPIALLGVIYVDEAGLSKAAQSFISLLQINQSNSKE